MKRKSSLFSLALICLLSLLTAGSAMAFPPLPSSFYGAVKANGANVPDGTLVRALINGRAYAQARTQTYQGDSVYSLDVPGDDSSTADAVEGGREGDTIQFEVAGALASQTGAWHSGTNVRLNLTASAAVAPTALAPTSAPAAVPTQPPTTTASVARTPVQTCPGLGLAIAVLIAAWSMTASARHTT